jgi:hypothetical protein
MKPITHIQLQTVAIFLIVYFVLFFSFKLGLDYTYGERSWYFIVIMPPVYFVAKRTMEWYQRRAIESHNRRIEQGKLW